MTVQVPKNLFSSVVNPRESPKRKRNGEGLKGGGTSYSLKFVNTVSKTSKRYKTPLNKTH
jgi:hypothetical protein